MINQKRLLDCFLELVQIDSKQDTKKQFNLILKIRLKKWGSMLKMKLQK